MSLHSASTLSRERHTFENQEKRFQIELEFVLCLSNPWYINFLAQQDYFADESFVRYLEYLQYWKAPEYAKFINYPMALYFLDLLQHSDFRDAMKTQEATVFVHEKQYYHWLYARRPKVAMEPVEDEAEPMAPGSELPTEI